MIKVLIVLGACWESFQSINIALTELPESFGKSQASSSVVFKVATNDKSVVKRTENHLARCEFKVRVSPGSVGEITRKIQSYVDQALEGVGSQSPLTEESLDCKISSNNQGVLSVVIDYDPRYFSVDRSFAASPPSSGQVGELSLDISRINKSFVAAQLNVRPVVLTVVNCNSSGDKLLLI